MFTIPISAFTMSDPGVHVALILAFTFDRSGRSGWAATRNCLRPVRKLLSKRRLGARVVKRYDTAQTPYQRLLAAGALSPAQREALDAQL